MPIPIASPTPTNPHFPLLLIICILFHQTNWMGSNFFGANRILTFSYLWSRLCLSDEKSALGFKFGRSAGRKRSIPVIHPPLPAPDSSDPSHPMPHQLSNSTRRLTAVAANNQSAGLMMTLDHFVQRMWICGTAAITHCGLHPCKVSPHESLVANWRWTHASCNPPPAFATHTIQFLSHCRCQGSHPWIFTCTCKCGKSIENPDLSFHRIP